MPEERVFIGLRILRYWLPWRTPHIKYSTG